MNAQTGFISNLRPDPTPSQQLPEEAKPLDPDSDDEMPQPLINIDTHHQPKASLDSIVKEFEWPAALDSESVIDKSLDESDAVDH